MSDSTARLPPAKAVDALRCPICRGRFTVEASALRCDQGHAFDIARQGYVNLLHAGVPAGTADTADMVSARAEFLRAGHYAPVADLLAQCVAEHAGGGTIVDAGAGTGYYLAHVLAESAAATGLALDLSARALRRAARAHPKIGAAVWNLWQPWPVADDAADVLLNVFAPRNGAEFHRVLRPGGLLVTATPRAEHLTELVRALNLLAVDRDKDGRLAATLDGHFELVRRMLSRFVLRLAPDDVRRVVRMGPNAHHADPVRDRRLATLSGPIEVTASCTVSVYRARTVTV